MANYLIQPDGTNTCCDCPSRTGPCDSCAVVCHATVTVQFNNVVFDCGCLTSFGQGYEITDIASFNGINLTMCPLSSCSPLPNNVCFYTTRGGADTCFVGACAQLGYRYREWNSGVCTGTPNQDFNPMQNCGTHFQPFLALVAGTWYVMVADLFVNALVFYGTTTDITLSIANQVVCSNNFNNWQDPSNCGTIATNTYQGIAHGGTAVVTLN